MSTYPIVYHHMPAVERRRLTVFFRLILAIPHFLWISLWQYAFVVVVVWAWLVALIFGRLEDDLAEEI